MDGWIDKRLRKPKKADCNAHGCILAWHELSKSADVVHLSSFLNYGTHYTHWMKLPGDPAKTQG